MRPATASWLFLVASIVGAWFTFNAHRPMPRRRHRAVLSFFAGWLTAELAIHHVVWQAVMTAVKENVKESGFYFFPWPEYRPGMTSEEKRQAMAKAEERWQIGPTGLLIAHPNGAFALSEARGPGCP